MAIQGNLQSIAIPELFSLLHQLRGTGVLSLVNDSEERGFLFYHGNLVYATSKDESRRLGHFLVRLNFLSVEELNEEFNGPSRSDAHLGQRLLKSGRISLSQLRDAVATQILDIMKEVMSWEAGAFHFEDSELPFDVPGDTLIRTQSVLLEASRMADEHDYAERMFPEKNVVLEQQEWARPEGLDEVYDDVLERVDGNRTVEQILFSSKQGPKTTAAILTDLLKWEAVRQSAVVVHDGSPPAPEIRGYPIAPQVPVRLFSVFNRPEGEEQVRALCELLAQEPMLTAKVLKTLTLRNVEIRRSQMTIADLVSSLGVFHLRCSLLPEAVKGIFVAKQLTFWQDCWEYSQIAACLCRELGTVSGYMFPGEAYLAGLLHKLGVFLLLHPSPEEYLQVVRESMRKRRDLAQLEEEAFGISHVRMGAVHAEKWRFPRMLLLAIKHHNYQLEARPANPLLHIVNVASGILRLNGYHLGYERGANTRFEYSLQCLGMSQGRATELFHQARGQALRGHYLDPSSVREDVRSAPAASSARA